MFYVTYNYANMFTTASTLVHVCQSSWLYIAIVLAIYVKSLPISDLKHAQLMSYC